MYILLVEDDELIGDAVQSYLTHFDHTLDWVRDGETAHEALLITDFDLVLLDLGLPYMDGFEILRVFRAKNLTTPVMIITARHGHEDAVRGFEIGADDYIRKPFELAELRARCEAISRRQATILPPDMIYGDLSINSQTREVTFKGQTITLSPVAYKLLVTLTRHPGMSYTREDLLQRLYGWDTQANVNAIDVLVSRLRHMLGKNIIQTVRGIGYKIGNL